MSKYIPITEFLKNQPSDKRDLTVTYETLEKVLGFSLPKSAHTHRPWWANEKEGSHTQARAWMGAGWKVDSVDFSKLRVRFKRESSSRTDHTNGKSYPINGNIQKKVEDIPNFKYRIEEKSRKGKCIVLVSCVKKKANARKPAEDLYISTWFKYASAFAKEIGGSWYILSAKYGLLDPNQMVEPYEKTLNNMPAAERRAWANNVFEALTFLINQGDEVVFLAGVRYREFLTNPIRDIGCKISIPMEGIPFFKQIQWLKAQYGLHN